MCSIFGCMLIVESTVQGVWVTVLKLTNLLQAQKFAPEAAPVTDEVTDLQQRLAILQQKRADDKAKIKELEKYKAQFNQV